MPRPLRIQYDDAYYHVMNRGRGRKTIFPDEDYYKAFLTSLAEAHHRFGLEVIAYCLMGNHYHLFVKTPRGNIDRCMRHINGVYTQRYNRLKRSDGPLFRGRYKAILVETDAYGLQVTRYIHRNPIETAKPLVDSLEDYPWSSYPATINNEAAPPWLKATLIYELLGKRNRYAAYKNFVELGNDNAVHDFYGGKHLKSVFGRDAFVEDIAEHMEGTALLFNKAQDRLPTIGAIAARVAKHFGVTEQSIFISARGRVAPNIPRWVALYCCRDIGQQPLSAIAAAFNMGHVSGIYRATVKLNAAIDNDSKLKATVNLLQRKLTP